MRKLQRLLRGSSAQATVAPSVLTLLLAVLSASLSNAKHVEANACQHRVLHDWLQHCSSAEDCTSDDTFCGCCKAHGERTEWASACSVICGKSVFAPTLATAAERNELASRIWRFDDFGENGPPGPTSEMGPYFEQPALSLVGDAAVVIGDCYNVDLRANQILNKAGEPQGTTACLLPPVTPKLFSSDEHLGLNLSICPSSAAPWHVHDPQPAALAAMLCFDECHVRNETQPDIPPPIVDEAALFIANCTRQCFSKCTRPLAAGCAAGCAANNYSCFGECHLRLETCSVPIGARDVRTFRRDPNVVECRTEYPAYESCVRDCNDGCHAELDRSRRTVFEDIDVWYNASCSPPLMEAAALSASCLSDCHANCTSVCNETVIFPLGPELGYGPALSNCTRECTTYCLTQDCFTQERVKEYETGCHPPVAVNCSAACFGDLCTPQLTYCSVYDVEGQLRHVDANCSYGFNITFQPQWFVNRSLGQSVDALLADPSSALSTLAGVNASRHICYNDCVNLSLSEYGSEFFFHGSALRVALNCTTTCYAKPCITACLDNCTQAEIEAAKPPCPLAGTPACLTPTNCSIAKAWGNCSATKAFEPVLINVTELTEGLDVWVPPWDQSICENLVDESVGSMEACAKSCLDFCEIRCPLPGNLTYDAGKAVINGASDANVIGGVLYNDTSGLCMQQCHSECTGNCSDSYAASVSSYWCATPAEPINWCAPPAGCTEDCSFECLDPTFLLETDPDCEEYKTKKAADGTNMSVVSLPLSFNVSSAATCSRNATQLGVSECPGEFVYHNVTEHVRYVFVTEACVRRCFERCAARCFERYCITRLEEPINETAICLPQCFERFFDASEPDLAAQGPSGTESDGALGGGALNGTNCYGGVCYNGNVSDCQLACDADCVTVRGANCTSGCDHIDNPTDWNACLSGCLANASAVCARDCVYVCTGNHTLAYGYPLPYDATGDYYALDDLHAMVRSAPDAGVVGPWSYVWGNASLNCHQNCTYYCARDCFSAVQSSKECDAEAEANAAARRQAGLPALHPKLIATEHNNCTYAKARPCLTSCRADCTTRCANLTDVVPQDVLLDIQLAQVYGEYVTHCEDKCRVQIYGRNVSRPQPTARSQPPAPLRPSNICCPALSQTPASCRHTLLYR
jgi:hypothetical protein